MVKGFVTNFLVITERNKAMFEGLVRQLILGYLGRYIKDIQKEQLKITLWNEEVLLENVELILEAFDYLQLPFALKQGRVGRLSIKIPWKSLGWDPIIITIEDVFVSACQRDDQEWSAEAVERREFSGKRAKLAAAELAKLSRRVCENQAGQSFFSYITAKILEGIQVSIRNVHVLYRDLPTDTEQTVIGLRFSSLSIMRQNPIGFHSGKLKGSQVNKLVEIHGLEIYCSTCRETLDLVAITNSEDSKLPGYANCEGNNDLHLLAPVDVSMSLMVSRSASRRNDAPQYSVNVELTELVMSLSEYQLGQILTLLDYLCICKLRKKYGRYRPWDKPLSRKYQGWQVVWWHYAQQSVLSDVRRKLKKSSWKYFGQRLNCRRKYVNLYKTKLKNLRDEQFINDDTLRELEQMEKESDLEDILNYRCIAENELLVFLEKANSTLEVNCVSSALEKSPIDERLSTRPRGWLNWLSRGMLGAGGTDDSSQFSGVVSDEVIKDIYEATKFKPASSPDDSSFVADDVFFSELNILIHKVSTTLWIRDYGRAAAKLILEELIFKCKLLEETLIMTSSVNSARIVNEGNNQNILLIEKSALGIDALDIEKPSVFIQMDSSSANQEVKVLAEVIQPLDLTYDSEFLLNIMEFYHVLKTHKFHHERVMSSLNEFEDVRARLLWKAEYTLSSRQRVVWDVHFQAININVISRNAMSESSVLVLQIGSFHFATVGELASASDFEDKFYVLEKFSNSLSSSDISTGIKIQQLYDHFELQVADVEMKVLTPYHSQVSVVEKMSASISLTSCVIPDESILLQLKVNISIQSLCVHFSPSIYLVGLNLLANENWRLSELESEPLHKTRALGIKSIGVTNQKSGCGTVISNLQSVCLHIDLENDKETNCSLVLNMEEVDTRYSFGEIQKCTVSSRTLKINSYSIESDNNSLVLCSSGNPPSAHYAKQQDAAVDHCDEKGTCSDESTYPQQCFLLHYEECKNVNRTLHKYGISLTDVDFHCYPYIIRLLVEFSEKILEPGASNTVERSFSESPTPVNCFGSEKFGFSNFSETGSAECTGISVENFPFITVHNVSSLSKGGSSFIQLISGWRNKLKLRENQVRSPELSATELTRLQGSRSKSGSRKDELVLSNDWDVTDLLIDLTSNRIRVHFHDSSCIVGTVSLTTSKSFLSSCGDCLDMLFSIEGLSFCSSWWTNNIQETLWGPSLKNISPILNLRVSKYKDGPLRSHCQISFSFQHVSCMLVPEFLAVIIGYFSLSDWYTEENIPEMENSTMISYMFEIVDSTISTECDSSVLKLAIPHLYGSFILDNCSNNVLKNIPPECSVAANKIGKKNHCLNLNGWDLSVSLLVPNQDALDTSFIGRKNVDVYEAFIAPLSADLWVLIPAESGSSSVISSASTCVMVRVHNCQLIAKGGYIFSGFEALLKIIDQFSTVDIESKCFRTDIMQFRHLKKSMKENETFVSEATMVLVDIRCCVDLLSVHFYHLITDADSSQQVARADTKFVFSASLENEIIQFLNVFFSTLTLCSKLSPVVLAECTSSSPVSSVLDISLSISDGGKKELLVSLPSLDVWLHLFDWGVVINLLKSYIELASTSFEGGSHVKPSLGPVGRTEKMVVKTVDYSSISSSCCSPPENMRQKATLLIVKSESLGINVYIPLWDSTEQYSISGEPLVQGEKPYGDSCKTEKQVTYNFMALSLQSRCSELIVCGSKARIKSHLAKIKGALEMCKGKALAWSSPTLPVFQFSHGNIEAEILNEPPDRLHTLVSVQCDSLELWLSYQIFYFLKCMSFRSPDSGLAQSILSVDLDMKLKKISVVLTDGRWSPKAPLLEALVRNFIFNFILSGMKLDCSVAGDLQVNYNNIRKVLWEPFVEPWKFQLNIIRLQEESALFNSSAKTNIHLNSTQQLNLNVTDSFIEVIFRVIEMVKDALGVLDLKVLSGGQGLLNSQIREHVHNGKYAPYILQNLTSLPLVFHVCQGPLSAGYKNDSVLKDGTLVNPGVSYPIYINGTPEEQLLRHRPAHSSERLSDKQFIGVAHNYVIIQFDGTAVPSTPISMDLVGPSYFEVDFSKSSYKREVHDVIDASKSKKAVDEMSQAGSRSSFVVPVVCDVSVQRYYKLVRLYSTVILFNGTSVPIEVRFDIPFGLSPKILDPIHPGREFPLPLHLAEAGQVSWRPLGQNVLWSEAHNLSKILSNGSRIGHLRSFVCYPSHPNSDPFRCCIAVQQMFFPPSVEKSDRKSYRDGKPKKYFIHQVMLSSPLVVRNFLPKALSLTLDCGGVTRTALLTEVESFFYNIDSLHDLEISFDLDGFGPAFLKFPRTETFSGTAKFAGTKFCQSETVTFNPDFGDGRLYVFVEKTMDAFSGAREICIYVPYLLYNCTAFPLFISDTTNGEKGHSVSVPSCYDFGKRDLSIGVKGGLGLFSSDLDFPVASSSHVTLNSSKSENVSSKRPNSFSGLIVRKPMIRGSSIKSGESSSECDLSSRTKSSLGSTQSKESRKLMACMYAPDPNSSMTEKVVKVRRYMPEVFAEHMPKSSWSSPFFLVQPAGSTTVAVPQLSTNAADVISVTSRSLPGQFSGKTRVVTFQPRYVISNACCKELYYKQKGTESSLYLGVAQHSHLQWTDTSRELLLSVRFDELGWQWSGCFSPDNLGDTQVKMRNYVTGAVSMIRVEVQTADVSIGDEKVVGSLQGNSGTNLILLSDDDAGFMPYRIDNFSKERLRVYQQSCETFETIIQSYTSCPYAWDEPCYPHRLTVEVPGQRIIGSYALDHVKDYLPVHLSSTSEKPERTLVVSVHAEGAVKVLSVIDSSYHVLSDANATNVARFREKRKHDQKEVSDDFNEKISVSISFIGISLMNSYPQELIFACAKKTRIDLLQSRDQQKFSLQIECLQIDNQLQSTPYPVILSFNREHRSNMVGQTRNRADNSKMKNESLTPKTSDRFIEPDFCLSAAKWKNKDASLVSFEYISLRLADFHLQVDQEIILWLLDFYRETLSGSPFGTSLTSDLGFKKESTAYNDGQGYVQSNGELFHSNDDSHISKSFKKGHLQPSIVPIGAPWQHIHLLARRQKKVYVEMFDLAPIKLTLSFSSTPWMLRNALLAPGESVIHRGLVALADIEGAQIYLGQLNVTHHMASWDSIQEIIIRHYTRQLLQEMYKVFGSAGVIGNPMGFARSVSLGIKDFVSAPARNFFKSPAGLITGMVQGTSSLLSNTVYALSDAATQFSRAAHKGIVAFTFDDQAVAGMEKQQKGISLHNKGVVDEFLEGLTGLLQSPIRGAEKHGLLGVLSGVAMGMTGLVAKPAASILDATGKTAQSIRNRSKLHQLGHHGLRVRLPRPLSRDLPLRPYSWEEAVGTTVLSDADDGKFKDESLILCKMLKQGGKLVLVTQRLVLIINCSSLVELGKPEFQGVPAEPEWVIEAEIRLDSVIHADTSEGVVHIVGSNSDPLVRQNQNPRLRSEVRGRRQWNNPSNTNTLPVYQTDLEFTCQEEAENFLEVLLSTVKEGKEHGWGSVYILHQSNFK